MFMYLFDSDENLFRKEENDSSHDLRLLLMRVGAVIPLCRLKRAMHQQRAQG